MQPELPPCTRALIAAFSQFAEENGLQSDHNQGWLTAGLDIWSGDTFVASANYNIHTHCFIVDVVSEFLAVVAPCLLRPIPMRYKELRLRTYMEYEDDKCSTCLGSLPRRTMSRCDSCDARHKSLLESDVSSPYTIWLWRHATPELLVDVKELISACLLDICVRGTFCGTKTESTNYDDIMQQEYPPYTRAFITAFAHHAEENGLGVRHRREELAVGLDVWLGNTYVAIISYHSQAQCLIANIAHEYLAMIAPWLLQPVPMRYKKLRVRNHLMFKGYNCSTCLIPLPDHNTFRCKSCNSRHRSLLESDVAAPYTIWLWRHATLELLADVKGVINACLLDICINGTFYAIKTEPPVCTSTVWEHPLAEYTQHTQEK